MELLSLGIEALVLAENDKQHSEHRTTHANRQLGFDHFTHLFGIRNTNVKWTVQNKALIQMRLTFIRTCYFLNLSYDESIKRASFQDIWFR